MRRCLKPMSDAQPEPGPLMERIRQLVSSAIERPGRIVVLAREADRLWRDNPSLGLTVDEIFDELFRAATAAHVPVELSRSGADRLAVAERRSGRALLRPASAPIVAGPISV
jgi:hypothetical protein